MKYAREHAESQEKQSIFEALDSGAIALDFEFLKKSCGEKVKNQLLRIPRHDRAYYLSSVISEDKAYFNGTVPELGENEILLDIQEIEIQFEGKPEEFFEDLNDWTIKENYAYLYEGYGLTIKVDTNQLEKDIDEILLSPFELAYKNGIKENYAYVSAGFSLFCQDCLASAGICCRHKAECIQIQKPDYFDAYRTTEFSKNACDICGTRLAGMRHSAHALDKDNNLIHLDICTDCILYMANGDLPETWEK